MALTPAEISQIAAAVAEQLQSEMGMLSAEKVLNKRKPPVADVPPPPPEEGEDEAMEAMASEMPEEEDAPCPECGGKGCPKCQKMA